MFAKGEKVIRIIKTPSGETGSVHKIKKVLPMGVLPTRVQLTGDEHLWYQQNSGREIDPAPGFMVAGISSRIIICE